MISCKGKSILFSMQRSSLHHPITIHFFLSRYSKNVVILMHSLLFSLYMWNENPCWVLCTIIIATFMVLILTENRAAYHYCIVPFSSGPWSPSSSPPYRTSRQLTCPTVTSRPFRDDPWSDDHSLFFLFAKGDLSCHSLFLSQNIVPDYKVSLSSKERHVYVLVESLPIFFSSGGL